MIEDNTPAASEASAPAEEEATTTETTTAAEVPAPAPVPKPSAKSAPPDGHWWWGTGRRKAAVAHERIRPGKGAVNVNKKDLKTFFTEERDHQDILNVLEKTNTKSTVDVFVNVRGGGYTGQAGAIVLGLGRALMKFDPSLEPILRDHNFLTRDPRKVERKKYGQPGARKRFQFSKR